MVENLAHRYPTKDSFQRAAKRFVALANEAAALRGAIDRAALPRYPVRKDLWSKAVRNSIRAAGARLFYLPKYSPDLNPIEQFFAKLKHWLRKAAKRTIEAVYNAIGPILDTVSAAECANYFANAGYDQT